VEGPDHLERMKRIVAISEKVAAESGPSQSRADRPVWQVPPPEPHSWPCLDTGGRGLSGKGGVRSQAGAACSIPIDGQFTRIGQAQRGVPGSNERRLLRPGLLEDAQHDAAPSSPHGKALTCGSLIAPVGPHILFCYPYRRHLRLNQAS
jgi:hypothetical protein